MVDIEQGSSDVYDQTEDRDQVGSHPHGYVRHHLVPPEIKEKKVR